MKTSTLLSTIKEVWFSFSKNHQFLLEGLIENCLQNWNFIIIPKTKITKITNSINKNIYWKGFIINRNGKFDEIEVTSSHLSNGWYFDNLLLNKEWYYIEGEKGVSIHHMKRNILSQKKLIDFVCSIEWIVDIIEEYEKIWYSNKDTIVYSNGILNLDKKEFIKKDLITNPNTQLEFNTYEKKYDMIESSIGLSLLFDELIPNETFRFILKWFFVSSIFRKEFFNHFDSFPLFYLSGIRGKGKTFLLRLLSDIVWFTKSSITSFATSTPFVLKKQLDEVNFYNFMDESQKIDRKTIEILKWNYDSHMIRRGSISKNWPITIETNNESILFVSWEALIWEEALQSRCLIHNFSQNDVKKLSNKEKNKLTKEGNNFFQNILLNKKDVDIEKIIERWRILLEWFDLRLETRTFNNLLIVICWNLIVDDNVDYDNIELMIKSYLKLSESNIEETISYNIVEDILNNFSSYSSLINYHKHSTIPLIYTSNNKLFFNFREIVKVYIKKNRLNDRVSFIKNQLLNYMGIEDTLKDKYGRFRLYDWVVRDSFFIKKEEVIGNEIFKNIWNRCILQIKKDVIQIEETIRKSNSKREQTIEDLNMVDDYHKLLQYSEKVVEKNGLIDLEVNIEDEIQNKIEKKKEDLISIYRSYIKWESPIVVLDREDKGLFLNIKWFLSYFWNDEKLFWDMELNSVVKEILGISNISFDLCDIDWIDGKSKKEYIKIKESIVSTNSIWVSLCNDLWKQYLCDKDILKRTQPPLSNRILEKEEKQKLTKYINNSIKSLYDID